MWEVNQVQNPGIQNVGNQNGLTVVPGIANQNGNGDWVILLGTAQSGQGEGMLLIFRLNYLDEIEEVNTNCILMANLQQASTSGTQTDKAPVYDSDGSAEEKSTVSSLQEEKKRMKRKLKSDSNTQKATKFVRDFKSLAKEDDESLAKHKALELEIKRFLRAVVSQDIMSIVQNNSVVDT
ncbi:hypothetical protein Tco_1096340 [Tanacetum coccineum]